MSQTSGSTSHLTYAHAQSVVEPSRVPPQSDGSIIQATGLLKQYQMGESVVTVLRDANLSIKPGEFIAIEGRSGSGKSTLLHILGALDTVNDGFVQFMGHDYTRRNEPSPSLLVALLTSRPVYWIWRVCLVTALVVGLRAIQVSDWNLGTTAIVLVGLGLTLWLICRGIQLARFLRRMWRDRPSANLRNREFGFVFQFYHLLPELNVLENVMLSPMIENSWFVFWSKKAEIRRRATEVLTQLGMSHRLTHRPNQLSGGERQRVAIARALMNSPRVLFADEPTGNLDADTGRQIMDVLEGLHRDKNQTIVMVTHDRALAREADRVLVLRDGALAPAE